MYPFKDFLQYFLKHTAIAAVAIVKHILTRTDDNKYHPRACAPVYRQEVKITLKGRVINSSRRSHSSIYPYCSHVTIIVCDVTDAHFKYNSTPQPHAPLPLPIPTPTNTPTPCSAADRLFRQVGHKTSDQYLQLVTAAENQRKTTHLSGLHHTLITFCHLLPLLLTRHQDLGWRMHVFHLLHVHMYACTCACTQRHTHGYTDTQTQTQTFNDLAFM